MTSIGAERSLIAGQLLGPAPRLPCEYNGIHTIAHRGIRVRTALYVFATVFTHMYDCVRVRSNNFRLHTAAVRASPSVRVRKADVSVFTHVYD